MAQKKKLRLTKNLFEVQTAFKDANISADIMLWFNANKDRALFMAKLVKVDLEQSRIILQLKDNVPYLDKQKQVYLKLFEDEGVSSCKVIQIVDLLLVLGFPDEIVMSERRRRWRAHFNKTDGKHATVSYSGQEHVFDVMNVSQSGLAIRLNEYVQFPLDSSQDLKVTKLNGVPLDDTMAGVVLHPSGLSCGLDLKKEIPDEVFDKFIHVDRPLAVDPVKLYEDQEYRAVVRSNMKQVLIKLEKKASLSTTLKLLKTDQDGSNYLKNHIELLCETICSVGKTLGWMTEGTLEKLIYVVYMHDVRFSKQPHLARIADLEEFNEKKKSLSTIEQMMYLEGPAYSAMLAAEDIGNSPDVEKILIQQKEKPDGSGFPAGIRSHQLAPLSCLFILCHEFVDYILVEPQWSFREFVVRSRPSFKRPYFAKILQAMMTIDKSLSKI